MCTACVWVCMSACRAVLPAELLLRTTGAWLPGPNGRAVVGVWCAAVAGTGCVPVWLSWLTVANLSAIQQPTLRTRAALCQRVARVWHGTCVFTFWWLCPLFCFNTTRSFVCAHTHTLSTHGTWLREIELQTPFVILGDSQLLPQCLPRICSGVVTGFHHCAHQQPRRDGHMRQQARPAQSSNAMCTRTTRRQRGRL